jgi:hypothetical protein
LSGPLTGTTVNGVHTFSGLSITEPGSYELVVDSFGLQSAVFPVEVTSGGGGSSLLGNLFFGTDNGLALAQLLDTEELVQAPGSPVSLGNVGAHDVATVGNFVYVTDVESNLFGFSLDSVNQTLGQVQSSLDIGSATEPALVTGNESNLVFVKNETEAFIHPYVVNTTTGGLTYNSAGGVATIPNLTTGFVFEANGDTGAGFLFDLNWDEKAVASFSATSAGNLTLNEYEFIGTSNDYPAGLAVVGDSVYVGVRSTGLNSGSRIIRLVLDRTNGTLSNSNQSWNSGVFGTLQGGFPDGTVDLVPYTHPALGEMLFAAHSSGTVTRFSVTQAGHLNQFNQTVSANSHCRRMLVRQTGQGDYLIVTADQGVSVFKIGEFDGNLTEVTGSPFTQFAGPFGVAR